MFLIVIAVYTKLLPASYAKAVAGIEARFFDDELDYHFENWEITYDIIVDEDGKATITNTMRTFLLIPAHIKNPYFKQNIYADNDVKLTSVFIDQKQIDLSDKTLFKKNAANTKHESELVLNLRQYAKNSDRIKFERTFVIVQDLKTEPYITAVVTRFIQGAVVKSSITPSHCVRFIPIGVGPVEEITESNKMRRWNLAAPEDLLLPGQGYTIIMVQL